MSDSQEPRTTSFMMQERQHKIFQGYRKLSIQITAKIVTSVPYIVLWVLWMCDVMIYEHDWDTIMYIVVLTGSAISFPWLTVSSFFNLPFTLEVWSYFSIIWAFPTMLGALQLVTARQYCLGCGVLVLALLSLFDGLISTTFRVPVLKRVEIVAVRRRTMSLQKLPHYVPKGDLFTLIPLNDSSRIPLDEFPRMSTPSSSGAHIPVSEEEDKEVMKFHIN